MPRPVPTLSQSLYTQPATSAANIEPTHISSIQPQGNTRSRADQVAVAKLRGKPAANPATKPTRKAEPGPGPSVCRDQAYRCERAIASRNSRISHWPTKNG